MPAYTKRKSKLHIKLTNSDQATAHGGQVLVDALCRRFGLWQRVHAEPSLDPRKRTGAGFSPVAHVAQLLFTLTSGGVSLADAERLGQDAVLLKMLGLAKVADQTTLGEWLRAQTPDSVRALHRLNAELVGWASQQAAPGRWRHGGQAEVFFDDTEIEVDGHKFEGARLNYEGNRALSWQTLWYGPWLLDGILDGAGDVSEHLPVLLAEHQARWQGSPSYFYADSASSAGKYINRLEQAGFTRWSISYNKWTDVLDRLAANCPKASGARCRQRSSRKNNMRGSSTSRVNASRVRNLRRCAGNSRAICCGATRTGCAGPGTRTRPKRCLNGTGSKGPKSRPSAKSSTAWICIIHPAKNCWPTRRFMRLRPWPTMS